MTVSAETARGRRAIARFGLGLNAGMAETDLAAIGRDPVGALMAELEGPAPSMVAELKSSDEAAMIQFALQRERRQARQEAAQLAIQPQTPAPAAEPMRTPAQAERQDVVQGEFAARLAAALAPTIGLRERLVWFWSNHFCISMDKGGMVAVMAGAYEREAIRRHVTGPFDAMLTAALRHPAMLAYLDNQRSIGPNSPAGLNRGAGLNENLAREILELHTLGVRTGYAQADVTALAQILTGWSFAGGEATDALPFRFRFNVRAHEPGDKRLLGKTYSPGEAGGLAALADLAARPETARHIATKLVRHFIADEPPGTIVERVARAFAASRGDLKQVARALVSAPGALEAPVTKLTRPSEWLVAVYRGLALTPDFRRHQQMLRILGEPTWRVPSPKGFPEEAEAWLAGLVQRADIAFILARGAGASGSPVPVAERLFGGTARPETMGAIRRAETTQQGIAMALMAPDFLRR